MDRSMLFPNTSKSESQALLLYREMHHRNPLSFFTPSAVAGAVLRRHVCLLVPTHAFAARCSRNRRVRSPQLASRMSTVAHTYKHYRLTHALRFLRLSTDLKKQFESPPYSVSVEAGQSTELRCLPPIGLPPPRVYWLRNGVSLDTDASETLLVSSEGHLLVGQAKLQHQANYTCVAENIAAKRSSEPASITVYGEFFTYLTLF